MKRSILTGFGLVSVTLAPAIAQRSSPQDSPQEERFHCHAAGVRVEGILTRRWFYGPPSFGETPKKDVQDEVFVLRLGRPITVVGPTNPTKDETCENVLTHVKQVQVWASKQCEKEIRKVLNEDVIITGELDEDPSPAAHIGVQITPVSIEPK